LGSIYQETEAHNPDTVLTADALAFQASRSVGERFRLSGDFGFQLLPATVLLPMHFRADGQFAETQIGVQLLQDIPTATVDLIKNKIREDGIGLSISKKLFDGIGTNLNYVYRLYSDRNRSNDLKLSSLYTITHEPVEYALGYRFRFLDFERQTKHGYFDPDYFVSHEFVSDLAFERDIYYGSIEWSVGHQAFLRNQVYNSGVAGAATLNLGVRLGKRLALELDGEGGNYALGSANGWEYYLTGVRMIFKF
jgi:hypothetical protein